MANKTLRIEFTHAKDPTAILPWTALRGEASLDMPALADVLNAFAAGLLPGYIDVALGETAAVKANATATLSGCVAGEKITINAVDFTAVDSGATGNQFNISGTKAGATAIFASVIATDVIVVNGVTFTCMASGATGDQFNVGINDAATVANAIAAINASVSAGVANITASGSTATLILTADVEGAAGNAFTLTTPDTTITVSGATFTGGGVSDTATAAALAAAINASTTAKIDGYVHASSALGVVTITADINGVVGNSFTLTETGTGITVTGSGFLAGGAGNDVTPTRYTKT